MSHEEQSERARDKAEIQRLRAQVTQMQWTLKQIEGIALTARGGKATT
jgi:hypothetical protein